MITLLLLFSTAFLLISPVAYAVSIIRGKSRPHRLTRLALMAAMLLSFISALGAHANIGTLVVTGIAATQGIVIFALSMWRGMGGQSFFDWACFIAALAGLAAWQLSGSPIVGMWFAVFADLVAYIPAIVKTWRHPHTEEHWFYTLSAIGVTLSLVSYPLSAASAFQVYLVICSLVMIFCIYHRQIFRRKIAEPLT
jgi:hypothetical protein